MSFLERTFDSINQEIVQITASPNYILSEARLTRLNALEAELQRRDTLRQQGTEF